MYTKEPSAKKSSKAVAAAHGQDAPPAHEQASSSPMQAAVDASTESTKEGQLAKQVSDQTVQLVRKSPRPIAGIFNVIGEDHDTYNGTPPEIDRNNEAQFLETTFGLTPYYEEGDLHIYTEGAGNALVDPKNRERGRKFDSADPAMGRIHEQADNCLRFLPLYISSLAGGGLTPLQEGGLTAQLRSLNEFCGILIDNDLIPENSLDFRKVVVHARIILSTLYPQAVANSDRRGLLQNLLPTIGKIKDMSEKVLKAKTGKSVTISRSAGMAENARRLGDQGVHAAWKVGDRHIADINNLPDDGSANWAIVPESNFKPFALPRIRAMVAANEAFIREMLEHWAPQQQGDDASSEAESQVDAGLVDEVYDDFRDEHAENQPFLNHMPEVRNQLTEAVEPLSSAGYSRESAMDTLRRICIQFYAEWEAEERARGLDDL